MSALVILVIPLHTDVPGKPVIKVLQGTGDTSYQITLNCSLQVPGYPKAHSYKWLTKGDTKDLQRIIATTNESVLVVNADSSKNSYLCYAISDYGVSVYSDAFVLRLTGKLV